MSHSIDSLLIPGMILKGNDIFPGYHHRNAPYFSVSGSRSMSVVLSMILKGNDIFPGYHHRNAPNFSVSGSRSMSVVFKERLYQSFLRRR